MLLDWLPFLLVACVGRGIMRVGAELLQGRIRYRRRSFNMAQGAHDPHVNERTHNSSTYKEPRSPSLSNSVRCRKHAVYEVKNEQTKGTDPGGEGR